MRVEYIPKMVISRDEFKDQVRSSLSRGFNEIEQKPFHDRPLAVVGKGPSLNIDELKAWPGDIWAINSTWGYLMEHGIEAKFLSIDALDLSFACEGAVEPLLAYCCHPKTFDVVKDPIVFHTEAITGKEEFVCFGGSTTASRAPLLALRLGYKEVHFFGCDCCFTDDGKYSLIAPADLRKLRARVNGRTFITSPPLLMQAEALSELIKTFPGYCFDKSGGLLAEMIKNKEWELVDGIP